MKGSVDVGALLMLAVSMSLAMTGQMLMKWGMSAEKVSGIGQLLGALLGVRVLAGLACFVISAMLWLVVLSRLDLSYAYPLVAFAQVVILMLLSSALLKESLPALRIAGLAVVCLGLVLVVFSYPTSTSGPSTDTDTSGALLSTRHG